ncbi:MAG: hypothetical protein HG450_004525 [Clostridiales bacterium]|nr:hypothetical protein [Clostridiales bacterium]
MFNRKEAINVIENQVKQKNNANIEKYQEILKKINSMSDEEFEHIVKQRIGENITIEMLSTWLNTQMKEQTKNEFIKLNNIVSYHVIHETIALHVVLKKITTKQARDSGIYLADALEKIRCKMQEGSFTDVATIFAVSDLLKLNSLQKNFKELGFQIEKGDQKFKKIFKNPYQASLSREFLLSDEWKDLKDKFVEGKLTIEEIENQEQIGK